jgi:hypothetical protein
VLNAEAPSSKLALAQLAEPAVRKELLEAADWFTESEVDSEDLVAVCIARVLDPDDAPWDPSLRTFVTHMTFVMRRVWYRDQRRLIVQRVVIDSEIAHDENVASPWPRPDDEVERGRSLSVQRMLGERVLASLGDDPIARRVFELGAEGLYEPGELAERIPCTSAEAKAALLRLKRHGGFVRDEWRREEQRRMETLQAESAERVRRATGWKSEGTR